MNGSDTAALPLTDGYKRGDRGPAMTRDEIMAECRRVILEEGAAVTRLAETLDYSELARAAEILGECKGRIIITGCGTSAMAARKIAHSLSCIERPALFLNPADGVHGGSWVIQKDDVLILLSKGGRTEELMNLIPIYKAKGAFCIVVSEDNESPLAKAADHFIRVKVEREPCPFNMLATSSILAVIAVFDAICIALMRHTGYTREQFALIHPGGAVGKRLTEGN